MAQLVQRLIDDLTKSIEAKETSLECAAMRQTLQKQKPRWPLYKMTEESWVHLTYRCFPGYLKNLLQFINGMGEVLSIPQDEKIDPVAFLQLLNENQEKVGAVFQEISNPRHIFTTGDSVEPLLSRLMQELDWIHSEALTLEACNKEMKSRLCTATPFYK